MNNKKLEERTFEREKNTNYIIRDIVQGFPYWFSSLIIFNRIALIYRPELHGKLFTPGHGVSVFILLVLVIWLRDIFHNLIDSLGD